MEIQKLSQEAAAHLGGSQEKLQNGAALWCFGFAVCQQVLSSNLAVSAPVCRGTEGVEKKQWCWRASLLLGFLQGSVLCRKQRAAMALCFIDLIPDVLYTRVTAWGHSSWWRNRVRRTAKINKGYTASFTFLFSSVFWNFFIF